MLDQTSIENQDGNPFVELVPDGASFIEIIKDGNKPLSSPNLSALNPLNWKPLITRKLDTSHAAISTIYTIFAAFSAYFSIYGISASLFTATFDGVKVMGGLDLKVAFSIAQMLGYAISKVAGAIIIPTIKRHQRCPILVLLAVLAEIPLILFGFLPPMGQVVMVFLSGIPMAWMWGIMIMYLEGRRTSEFLLMGLYLSVMVASGAAKSIAAAVLQAGIPESWMPALCGAFSALAFVIFIVLLDAVPDPSSEDRKVRSERRTITQAEARRFLVKWAPGLVIVTLIYSLLTAYRNFRDYFAPELWRDLEGADFNPSMFTQSELPVGICTAVAYSLLYWMKDNKKAFFAILGVMFLGGAVILIATLTQIAGLIDPLAWMIMVGVGLYMAYIPPGAMLYDRFNGATGHPYTSVFMIYLSDVCGYSATLVVLFYRNFGASSTMSYVAFFHDLSFAAAIACMCGMVLAAIYFMIAMRNLHGSPTSHVPLKEEEEGEVGVGMQVVQAKKEEEMEHERTMSVQVSDSKESEEENASLYAAP